MNDAAMLGKVEAVFHDVLDNPAIRLTEATTAADVEDWDSLNHIQFVVAVEKAFGVKFTSAEIQGWNNVGDMLACIRAKGK
jgi:acyl carrier protein